MQTQKNKNEKVSYMGLELPPTVRQELRDLLDDAWNECTDSQAVPSTEWADSIIDKWITRVADNFYNQRRTEMKAKWIKT